MKIRHSDRLNVVPIDLPPLRDRGEDVVALAEHFVSIVCADNNRPMMTLDAPARELMGTCRQLFQQNKACQDRVSTAQRRIC